MMMGRKNKPGSWKNFRKRFIAVERYKGILECHYCEETIDMENKPPNPRALTIDHVVPLSKGGGLKDKDNVVVCCWQCNAQKGDTG